MQNNLKTKKANTAEFIQLFESSGMTQTEVARICLVSPQAISHVVSGNGNASPRLLAMLKAHLNGSEKPPSTGVKNDNFVAFGEGKPAAGGNAFAEEFVKYKTEPWWRHLEPALERVDPRSREQAMAVIRGILEAFPKNAAANDAPPKRGQND